MGSATVATPPKNLTSLVTLGTLSYGLAGVDIVGSSPSHLKKWLLLVKRSVLNSVLMLQDLFQSCVLLLTSALNIFFHSSVNYFLFKLLFSSSNAVIMLEYRQGKFNVTEDVNMKCWVFL